MSKVVREAKIFEAAEYSERGLLWTEADLDAVISHFDLGTGVPVKYEHTSGAFDGKIAWVKKLWRKGKDLMGRMEFESQVVYDAIKEMLGTIQLSAGFSWDNKNLLEEVSITDMPRVLTAQVFRASIPLLFTDSGFDEGGVEVAEVNAAVQKMLDEAREEGRKLGHSEKDAQFTAGTDTAVAELAKIRRENNVKDADVLIDGWLKEGKLLPAAVKFAQGILVDGGTKVTFSDGGSMETREAFLQFMTSQGAILNVETPETKDRAARGGAVDTPEAKTFYSDMGLSDDDLEKYGE